MGGAPPPPSPMSSSPCEAARSVAEGLSATVLRGDAASQRRGGRGARWKESLPHAPRRMKPPPGWFDAAPLVIAHRGASAAAPENTLLAFEQAVQLGAEAIELDAKRTRDGEVVCFHDRTLLRTTGVAGTPGSRTLGELRTYDVGAWKGEAFGGQRVPTLSEVLEAVGWRILVNIELTDYWADQPQLAEAVVAILRRHRLERRILVSSFQSSALVAAEARRAGGRGRAPRRPPGAG